MNKKENSNLLYCNTEQELETRSEENNPMIVSGYIAKWNTPTKIREFTEQIKQGAFTKSLENRDIVALYNHDKSKVLGRLSNGTLQLREDDVGLYADIYLDENQSSHRDLYSSIKRGDIKGCSFGFIKQNSRIRMENRMSNLVDVDLREVTITAFPQYTDTVISARSEMYEEMYDEVQKDFMKKELEDAILRIEEVKKNYE